MDWSKWSRRLKILVAFLIPIMVVMVFNSGLDNDSWYILAEGREIVENGIYYEDQLSMHEGLEVTVQNYGFAVIFYLLFSAFGGIGIYIMMLLLNILLCYLIYKVCMLLSNKNLNLSLLLMVLTDSLLATGFVVTRAQMVSYVIFVLVIYLLELYVRKGKIKILWWVPMLSVIQINLHASVWPMILILIAVYIIDSIKQPKLRYDGYKVKPLLIIGVVSTLVAFLNPYGLKMMTFILTSYGIPEANNYIVEMLPFNLVGSIHILRYTAIVLALVLYIFGKNKNIRVRYLILFFGFLTLGLKTSKGMSYLTLVLLFPMAEAYKNVKIRKIGNYKIGWAIGAWVGLLTIITIIGHIVLVIPNIKSDGPSAEIVTTADALDFDVGDKDKSTFKIYTCYDEGGYLEYRGYKPYIDPRMEVFLKANNNKEDIFHEYYELQNGRVNKKEFFEKYNFDYLVVKEEADSLYDIPDFFKDKYKILYEYNKDTNNNEIDGSYGVRLYKKIEDLKEV